MEEREALREFLTSRRAAVDPADTGLPASATARRVPGLRREEVAALAGISAPYYTRLEQGRVGDVSEQVLLAVANVLRLDALERDHFRALLDRAPRRSAAGPVGPERVRPALAAMVDALRTPALVHGPSLDVLAANRGARVLLDDFPALPRRERNLARWTFLNPRARLVLPRWDTLAPQVAASVRHLTVARPGDAALRRLAGELRARSPEFARHWDAYLLHRHGHGTKRFRHEAVGEFDLRFETFALPADEGLRLVVYTADRGSAAEEKLRLLAAAPA
ncbi:helix-turn-helix domain-containing protein [Streptomyces sp. 3MP-14]|uniref:Helix-turn-helix domain-containing protein n=1 Tax=Streptomyces mimosae TaxID=2586635 RepID=A0A5N6A3S1_9ACTN|nr:MULTISPECIES: helix-turn-helix transcriptional regulator [Streptomyces]KAB8163437.1 helix-turn-helix domain-containing protein [Streptomyces mimosae]KAB8174714.1 helix-turn-helix domain-containing protein [Streptomyces sp. 3MP-14]